MFIFRMNVKVTQYKQGGKLYEKSSQISLSASHDDMY